MLNHIKDNNNLWTVVLEGKPHQFDPTHAEYINLVECVKVGDAEAFLNLFNVGTVIENWSEGNFTFKDGFLYYDGDEQIATQPTERIIDMLKNGWDHTPILGYLEKLYQNVSRRAVQESYNWSMNKGLPITPDGCMIGYKGVKVHQGADITDKLGRTITEGDSVDKYTGRSFRNNVGDENQMARRQVCDDFTKGCESGLHVGTFDYAQSWAGSSGKVILVKFSPADIVSVPSCSSFKKIRVCQYTVLEVARDIIESPVHTGHHDEDEDEDEDEEDLEDPCNECGEYDADCDCDDW